MTVHGSIDHAPRTGIADLQTKLVDYAGLVDELRSPKEVLNELHAVTTHSLPLPVLGAACLPIKSGDWEAVQLGKSAFLHDNVPDGWWEEYEALARGKFRPALFLAGFSMASHTWTEVRRLMQPIGIDKWSYELCLKHGMRDGLMCPVGGRWVVGFWSRKELSNVLTRPIRTLGIRCREHCGIAIGATRSSRFRQVRATWSANAPRTCCPAIGVHWRAIV